MDFVAKVSVLFVVRWDAVCHSWCVDNCAGYCAHHKKLRCLHLEAQRAHVHRYGINLLTKVQYSGVTYYNCEGRNPSDPANTPGCIPLTSEQLTADLRLARDVDEWPWCVFCGKQCVYMLCGDLQNVNREAIVLVGYCIVLRIMVYICLRVKTGKV